VGQLERPRLRCIFQCTYREYTRGLVDLGAGGADGGEEAAVSAAAGARNQRWAVEGVQRKRCCIRVDGQVAKWVGALGHHQD
jgi:hypothetical protein